MLLFKPEHVKLIKEGIKTQSRRLWIDKKTGKLREKPRCKVGSIHLAKTKMLSKEYFAKLPIERVWRELLGDISKKDAIAEGYKDGNDYLRAFFIINKIPLKAKNMIPYLESDVWCIEWDKNVGDGGVNE